VAALEGSCNIIPVMDNFQWPPPESLPDDMRAICYFNSIRCVVASAGWDSLYQVLTLTGSKWTSSETVWDSGSSCISHIVQELFKYCTVTAIGFKQERLHLAGSRWIRHLLRGVRYRTNQSERSGSFIIGPINLMLIQKCFVIQNLKNLLHFWLRYSAHIHWEAYSWFSNGLLFNRRGGEGRRDRTNSVKVI